MEAIKNGLRKNLTPAQLWSGARFFLLLNLGLIIYAVALNFYCAPNHFVFGGTTGLSIVLAGYGSVLLHSGADAYIVVSVGSFVTGVVFTLLGIRYRQYKTLHRPFSPDAADKASSQSLSDDQ